MEQEMVIGCMPCVDSMALGYLPYKNSTVAKCSRCNKDVWLGPKQKEVVEKHHYPITSSLTNVPVNASLIY